MELTPYTLPKFLIGGRLVMAACGMLLGLLLSKTALAAFGILMAVASFFYAVHWVPAMFRLLGAERVWRAGGGAPLRGGARQASDLPRQIFLLLFTVAEADGRAGAKERALVQQFVLQRFLDPGLAVALQRWEARALPADELATLVHGLRARLSGPECETLFFWCCLVALIDEKWVKAEQEVLGVISKHLGLDANYARVIFHQAKARVMAARAQEQWQEQWRRAAGGGRAGAGPTRESAASRRQRALQTLGLDESASQEQIRRRHRELVKKHHPDAHGHLGPVAQQDATERFREVQAAYEELTGKG